MGEKSRIVWAGLDKLALMYGPTCSVDNRELKQRRFCTTDVNRKLAFFSFSKPWRYRIYIAKCLNSYRDDLPKNLFKITAKCAKSPFPVDVRRSKTSLLSGAKNRLCKWSRVTSPWQCTVNYKEEYEEMHEKVSHLFTWSLLMIKLVITPETPSPPMAECYVAVSCISNLHSPRCFSPSLKCLVWQAAASRPHMFAYVLPSVPHTGR